jgi:hypothetical protein
MASRLNGMRLNHVPRRTALAGAAGVLLTAALAACSAPAGQSPAAQSPISPPTTNAGFTGYKWAVESISHDGKTTPVTGKYSVYLQFTPDGHFGAKEPVNYHSGSYRVTPSGFTTSGLGQTTAGYIGHDPVVLLSVSAISAFGDQVHALVDVSGSTMTVTVGGYTLIAQRDGRQANFQ